MQILVVHDQYGEIRSVAVPGQKLPSDDGGWRPAARELVAVVDIPDFPEGTNLSRTLEIIRSEYRVSEGTPRLIPKKQGSALFASATSGS